MTSQEVIRNLRYILATIYDNEITARRVAQDAGLDLTQIAFSPRAIDNWHAILSEAHETAHLHRVLAVALTEYGDNQPLRDAYTAYCHVAEGASLAEPSLQLSLVEDAPAAGEPPYKGLSFFDVNDASRFFGREQLVESLVAHLHRERFLAVIGASGSGKSSVIRAGLVAAIQKDLGRIDSSSFSIASSPCSAHIITPTDEPLEALAAVLTCDNPSVTLMDTMIEDMVKNPRSLHRHIKRWLTEQQLEGYAFVLIIDQFEELFTLCRDPAKRVHFVDNLMAAVSANGPTRIVLTLRADFYAHCAQFSDLRQALANHQVYIGSMSSAELHSAITEPAYQGKWMFESGLVDLLLNDVDREPGALPLLSHALLETWRRRRGRTMTLAGYIASGRVQGAIAQTAEQLFIHRLTIAEQAIAKIIFLRLTELGEGTEDTRRRIRQHEVTTTIQDSSAVHHVLQTLATARLITIHEDELEVAHEALIREWPRLRRWLAEDREALQIHRRLTHATKEWMDLNYDPGALFRGARLEQAAEWAQDHFEQLNEDERNFLMSSQQTVWREQKERDARQWREVAQQRLLATRQRWISGIIAAAFVLSLIAAIVIYGQNRALEYRGNSLQSALTDVQQQKRNAENEKARANQKTVEAEQQSRIALSRQLAAQAISTIDLNQDIELGLLVAVEAARLAGDSGIARQQVDNALRRTLAVAPMIIRRLDTYVISIAFSPDGERFATAETGDHASLWDSSNGNLVAILQHNDQVNDVVFSPDGKRLATFSINDTRLWNGVTGEQLALLDREKWIEVKSFSPDSTQLATVSGNNVKLWDGVTGKPLSTLHHEVPVRDLRYSPDGHYVATVIGDDSETTRIYKSNAVVIWNTITKKQVASIPYKEEVTTIDFSPNSKYIAVASIDHTATIWSNDEGESIISVTHEDAINDIAFSPDGTRFATASSDFTAKVWDSSSGAQLTRLPHGIEVREVSFSLDGTRLATYTWGGQYLWDSAGGSFIRSVPIQGKLVGGGVADNLDRILFSPDSKYFATAFDFDNVVRLWNSTKGNQLFSFTHDRYGVSDMAFSPNSKKLITADFGSIRIWDTSNKQEPRTFISSTGVADVSFSPDSKYVAIASGNVAKIWDITSNLELSSFDHEANVTRVTYSPDGVLLATVGEDHTVRLWNNTSGKQIAVFPHKGYIRAATFAPNGTRFVTTSNDNTNIVYIWDTSNGEQVAVLPHEDFVSGISFSPNSEFIATTSHDSTVRIWKSTTVKLLKTLPSESLYGRVRFSPDSRFLATVTDSFFTIWNTMKWEKVGSYEYPSNDITHDNPLDIAFSLDNTRFVIAGQHGVAWLWNIANGKQVAALKHDTAINTVDFSPDSKRLATASYDHTARIWDSTTGELLSVLSHDNIVNAAVFSPDGSLLATASNDDTARLWRVDLNALVTRACEIISRDLTQEEWAFYFADAPVDYHSTCQGLPVFAH